MDQPQLSLNDLQEYRAYRVRLAQFLHFFLLYEKMKEGSDVPENVMGHKADKFANSLQVATLGWLASLVDTNNSALNVFRLWKRLFPARSAQIEAVEASIQPQLKTLIKFRNEVAFHANKSF